MYDNITTFVYEAEQCGDLCYPDSSLEIENLNTAYSIYDSAKKGTTLYDVDDNIISFGVTVVGRLALKVRAYNSAMEEEWVWVPSDESFPSIDEILIQNLGKMCEETNNTRGSILDASRWTLIANDAWLLGSMHAITSFHFASPLSWSNLWDKDLQRVTVTGRELIGIIGHGYKLTRPNPKLELVAVCENKDLAMASSLLSYKDKLHRHGSYSALREVYDSLPSEFTNY
ncbi:hypothetical protein [Halomonas sp.]|uniref:hypothetical protein n=1 Tax=Halomonas sp. TaxID=1486246 RepID=UPI00298D8D92|nr:hypothetical protein [Halomonas sp.]MDW7662471.1 hypothetical protein [Bacillota bacterium]MDW7748425.1 hypothetical protein [Halomonas sp.]